MEKLCIHVICDNPRAYKALESVCLGHAGAFIDFEQSYESWCSEQQYVEDTVPLCTLHHNPKRKGLGGKPPTQRSVSDDELEPNVRWVTGTPPAPCLFCGGREFHKDNCRMSPIIR